MGYSTVVLFSKIIINGWNGWVNFLNNISLLGHMKNSERSISTSTRFTTTKLDRVVTSV